MKIIFPDQKFTMVGSMIDSSYSLDIILIPFPNNPIKMSRIEKTFSNLKDSKKSALVCYITAGDPSLEDTKKIVMELERAGADIIELGIPFSDPMADGPTIQLASERSLANGTNISGVLRTVREIREHSEIPLILFGYYNPFFKYGLEKFAVDAVDAGADGVLVVDLPPDEADEFKVHLDKMKLDTIFLLAPNSTDERIELIAERGTGFVYLVSVTGVTGSRPDLEYSLNDLTEKIKSKTGLPVGIGFGVSSAEQAKRLSEYSDAVIVGSSIIKIIENNNGNRKKMLEDIFNFARELGEACHGTED